jgi:Ca2+-binding EF-hand superfamily protein
MSEDQLTLVTQAQGFFQSFDSDESGSLSSDEFKSCYADMAAFGFAMTDCESAMQELDTDGNGVVNFNEFIRWMINVGALQIGS